MLTEIERQLGTELGKPGGAAGTASVPRLLWLAAAAAAAQVLRRLI